MVPPTKYPFPVSGLNLCPSYASRAAAVLAGQSVGAFDPTKAIKGWVLPKGGAFSFFDATTGQTGQMPPMSDADAQAFNLPGAATFPAYVVTPCQVNWAGGTGDVSGFVCLKSDAEAVMALIQPLFFATLTLAETDQGQYAFTYPAGEQRREWVIEPIGKNAQELVAAMNWNGVGKPGAFVLATVAGFPGQLEWQAAPQVTIAPPNAVTLPVPIRALLPGEAIEQVTGVLPGSNAWQVVNSEEQAAALLATIKSEVAEYNSLPGVAPISVG